MKCAIVWISGAVLVAGCAQGPGPEPVPVAPAIPASLDLAWCIRSALRNHPELAATVDDPDDRAGLAIRPAGPGGAVGVIGLREQVNGIIFEAIRTYWDLVLLRGLVPIREQAVAAAVTTLETVRARAHVDATGVDIKHAEGMLAGHRIALVSARQRAQAAEDRLKLLMLEPALSVASETKLVLRLQVPEPVRTELDLGDGIRVAVRRRFGTAEGRPDKARRKRFETIVFEVRDAHRRIEADWERVQLGRQSVTVAEAYGENVLKMAKIIPRLTPQFLDVRARAFERIAEAKCQSLTARVEYHVALAAWDRATAELHRRWHIKLVLGSSR